MSFTKRDSCCTTLRQYLSYLLYSFRSQLCKACSKFRTYPMCPYPSSAVCPHLIHLPLQSGDTRRRCSAWASLCLSQNCAHKTPKFSVDLFHSANTPRNDREDVESNKLNLNALISCGADAETARAVSAPQISFYSKPTVSAYLRFV